MDVDSSDLDGKLLQQFSAMGTTDREVLIAEFQKLLGNTVNPDSCAFYLDMNNWNLQAAICSYYDIEHPPAQLPSMTVVDDVTIGEGESVAPNNKFFKAWRIKNTGCEWWPPGSSLRCVQGDSMGHGGWQMLEALGPGESQDIRLELTGPPNTGLHQGQWRASTPTGQFFGESIWVLVTVEENGMLGLTQQMSRIGAFVMPEQPDPTRLIHREMALLPMNPASDPAASLMADNPQATPESELASQPPQMITVPATMRWLSQSSTDTNHLSHADHSEDTEMS